jgi:acyl carrier protein
MKNINKVVLTNISKIKGKKITDENLTFEGDLSFDSIEYINLVSILSDELDINILDFDEEELRLKYIKDLISLLERKSVPQ